ncbi:MAG: helix-turn-helix domain-containing protein [Solirubrobacteraceae bacterium]|jgi:AcrR family transcriptional regulator
MSATRTRPDTQARILETALALFSEHGFERTTLQQIADRLGFTKAALYYHFRSKDDLLAALVLPATTELDELLCAHHGLLDVPGHRRRFLEAYLDYLLRHRRLIAYMVSDIAVIAHPAIAGRNDGRRRQVDAMLAGDGLDLRRQVRVTMAVRGMGAVIAQYPDADVGELRDALLDGARALLRPSRRGPAPGAESLSPPA